MPDDAVIENIVKDGKVELELWTSILSSFLGRIDHIAQHSFPPTNTALPPSDVPNNAEGSSGDGVKREGMEEAESSEAMDITSPSAPLVSAQSQHSPETLLMIAEIKETLSTTFVEAPPHTIQRLAELLQRPNEHYRSLIKFLRAVQRVISVSSTISQFPLPSSMDIPSTGMLNMLGSDESLGGALLTPISWLKDDALLSEGDVETKINGVSEVQFLRQEPELDINGENLEERVEVHAQGPPTLGPEDLGPQPPGVVFPDLDNPQSESARAIDAETLAKQDELMEDAATPAAEDDGEAMKQESTEHRGDMMDVDEKEGEIKEKEQSEHPSVDVKEEKATGTDAGKDST